MIAEHNKLMKPADADAPTDEEFDGALDRIRAMNLPDVKV